MSKQKEDPLAATMRILKTAACGTVSGSDPKQLKYEIGATPENEIHLRIAGNTGTGSFSDEWIALNDILKTLEKRRGEDPITSYLLDPLFKGRSVNTPAFLLAVLSREKLVRPLKGKRRLHEPGDVRAFTERMNNLVTAGGEGKTTPTKPTRKKVAKKTARKKAPAKKKATVKKKTPVEK